MDNIWFVEERLGDVWSPTIYHGDKPLQKHTGSPKKNWKNSPVLIETVDQGKPLKELVHIYGNP